MTWAPLLLADPSPNLRLLVLRELLHWPAEEDEVRELAALREKDPIVQNLLMFQDGDGSWQSGEGGEEPHPRIRSTALALLRLGYLGMGPEHNAVCQGAEYLFAHQQGDGSWPLPKSKAERELREAYSTIPFQTSLPLRSLASAGYALDPRAERGYDWLLEQRLPEGAWPSGVKGGQNVFPAGYRRLAHSRFGCRTNTSFAVSALALHPERRTSEAARRGLDLLLAQESLQASNLGHQVARTIGLEQARGWFTYFARHDAAFVLDLCWRIEASLEDPRVAGLVDWIRDLQGPYGLWAYPAHPAASRWVSFDLLRSLSRIDEDTAWVSLVPPTPFQAYPKQPRRY